MSLANLNDRLDHRFRLLTGGSRSALPRQQTLRATVEWSYSLLNSSEQSLLRRLSVFAESFDLEAAEKVCCLQDIEEIDVDDLLGSLVDKNLVVTEPSGGRARYRLLETIRQFAAERLVESDEVGAAAIGAAHASHYLSLAELAAPHLFGPEQGRWFARLDADQANLQRALEHSTAEGDGTERVLRFGAALQRYWRVRGGRNEEAIRLLTSVLERPEAEADPKLFAAALVTVEFVSSDTRTALLAGERAVEIARQLDDDRLLIWSLDHLCSKCYFGGDPKRGFPLGKEAVAARQVARRRGLVGQQPEDVPPLQQDHRSSPKRRVTHRGHLERRTFRRSVLHRTYSEQCWYLRAAGGKHPCCARTPRRGGSSQ